jgi:hypothetical protein
VKSHLTICQHAEKVVNYERHAAWLTVRGCPEDPEPYWILAQVHRAWVRKLRTSV